MLKLHYLEKYFPHVAKLKEQFGRDEGMHLAVGGQWEWVGRLETDLLRMMGLRDGMRLVDLGCGSGRLAVVLAKEMRIEYHGIDIVPDLLEYAKEITPPAYRFSRVENIEIPDTDQSADMICAFSLFTHLLHEETYIYLEECARVLKPGGKLVFSFLELAIPPHWAIFQSTKDKRKAGVDMPLNVFFERPAIEVWAKRLNFRIDKYLDSTMGDTIPLSKPTTDPKGVLKQNGNMGQSVCVLTKI
ncbi:MAG: class I SAM-dependent methyltransferase [Rhizobiaceae bacterium]